MHRIPLKEERKKIPTLFLLLLLFKDKALVCEEEKELEKPLYIDRELSLFLLSLPTEAR